MGALIIRYRGNRTALPGKSQTNWSALAVRDFTWIGGERERTGYGYKFAVRDIDMPRLWDALSGRFDGFYVNVGTAPTRIASIPPGTASMVNAWRTQFRHSAGTYLYCAGPPVLHTQVTRAPPYDGVKIMVTEVPTDVADPATVMTPPSVTAPPVILPPIAIVRPIPALASVASVPALSVIVLLKAFVPATNSDTLARIV